MTGEKLIWNAVPNFSFRQEQELRAHMALVTKSEELKAHMV